MLRRIAVLLAIVVVFGAIGAIVFGRRSDGDGLSAAARSNEATLPAAICHFESLIAAGNLAEAKNVFWDEVHTPAHILGADIEKRDRAAGGAFFEAKGAVERDLATLAPALQTDGPAFGTKVREALRIVGVAGADQPC